MSISAEVLATSLFAIDAHAFGGVCLRSPAGAVRDRWLQLLRDLLPHTSAIRKIPCNIADSRLLGGLDLAGTLRDRRPVLDPGILASIDEGVLVIAMAERLSVHTASLLCSALDQGHIHVAREGVILRHPTRFGMVALDESVSEDESTPACVLDRCAFLVDLGALSHRIPLTPVHDRLQIDAARALLPRVTIQTSLVQALCATAMALGAGSVRVSILAALAARALAALDGRSAATEEDAETAGKLVLAPRASALPQTNSDAPEDSGSPSEPNGTSDAKNSPAPQDAPQHNGSRAEEQQEMPADVQQMQDVVLAATQSAIPRSLLTQLQARGGSGRVRGASVGRFGAQRMGGARGRPIGVTKPGAVRSRLNVLETLRAAAPWQSLRNPTPGERTLQIRSEDLRVTRYKQRSRTLTIFAVDASGSSALNRLAETKGAAELLLADCYVRRDQVAVIAFRGTSAEIILPPTRSLVRAKRSLSAMPGGGGTPLAAAIDTAALLAAQSLRRGESPIVVILTDGRGNIARDGRSGREAGQADAMRAARAFSAAKISALFVDTSPRPHDLARHLARGMSATYVALPFADAASLSRLVGAANLRGRARP